jgi:hypothetical protein
VIRASNTRAKARSHGVDDAPPPLEALLAPEAPLPQEGQLPAYPAALDMLVVLQVSTVAAFEHWPALTTVAADV